MEFGNMLTQLIDGPKFNGDSGPPFEIDELTKPRATAAGGSFWNPQPWRYCKIGGDLLP
jgi:hypothetical protein